MMRWKRCVTFAAALSMVAFGGMASADDEAVEGEPMSARQRQGYAIGYELGRRLAEEQIEVSPEEVVQAINDTEAGDVDPPEQPSTSYRLGVRIAQRRPGISADMVAQGLRDAAGGGEAVLDEQQRRDALINLQADDSPTDAQRIEALRRAGYGWHTPGAAEPGRARPSVTAQPVSTLRTSASGRIDASIDDQVHAAVPATSTNTAEVDAYEPVPGSGPGGTR